MTTNPRPQAGLQVLAPRPEPAPVAARAIFKLTALYGRGLYKLKLGRVCQTQRGGQAIYIKTRHRRSALLVGVGNALLKASGGELRGLPEREWLGWEQQVGALAWPEDVSSRVRVRGRSLLCPALPGEPLAHILGSARDLEARLRAVEIAARELQRLQRLELSLPDRSVRLWSHGDAHAGNVVVDLSRERAAWFDFETVHASWCPPLWRQADDLRALAYSCASACCPCEHPALARALAGAIECRCLSAELERQSRVLERRASALHLAQAPLGWAEHQRFGRVLRAEFQGARGSPEPGAEPSTQVRAASTCVLREAALSGGTGGAGALEST